MFSITFVGIENNSLFPKSNKVWLEFAAYVYVSRTADINWLLQLYTILQYLIKRVLIQ